ncbi:RBBP8 N-terminal-like protein isoform X1 [Mauremys mutica]|uniref:RBBP8 N-terminal-like protein isoform X1 n=1 Tax=Mauremys mutica TaxID=74926 RepID=UPI001D16F55F|nr:RBBP8 N-terminal-like protein isoform X1 [Mauremys mutica]XP_044841901.1 RBBP8 N-terminal-like protein isoform X1 [Mauremys mutica]XP_044841902.1 RBBP8 N-terminal-like protein isoform X1 [Mauremys mutica]
MATESFSDFLNKLKEIHEKEVLGLQTKLTELTTEKCRDAQRIEELFAKNHQLREQQKILKENVKVLENRLRAGLCDRCMVAQELAKKKQNEYEHSHFQSLQHIFILTNEMSRLKEENKNLKEELKRLRSLDDRSKHQRALPRDSSSIPDSPLALLSPVSRKPSTGKAASREAEEGYHEQPGQQLGEETSAGQRCSLGSRISPSAVLQEAQALEMTSQRIANQLHGTIALVRPGSRPYLPEKISARRATSPPARKNSLFLEREHSPSREACLRTNKPDSHKATSSYGTLQLTTRQEQLCLLNKHFSLHQLGLRSNSASADRDNSLPSHLLQARETEDRTRLQEEWEDQAAILELPGAVVYMRDQHLEGRLPFLKHREKLQYLLAQEHQQGFRARTEGNQNATPDPAAPEERPLSPQPTMGCKEERSYLEEPVEGKVAWINRDNMEQREKAEAARECLLDAPLDLSDYGRRSESLKPASWHKSPKQREVDSPSPIPMESPTLETGQSSSVLSRAEHENSHLACSQLPAAKLLQIGNKTEQFSATEQEALAAPLVPSSQGQPTGKLTSCDPATDSETRVRVSPRAQKREPGAQTEENDAESVKQDSDEPDTSDSEVAATYEHETHQEEHADGKHLCTEDKDEVLQKKRKRGQDPGTKAYKKAVRGKRKIKAPEAPADAAEITKETEHNSPACGNDVFEEN